MPSSLDTLRAKRQKLQDKVDSLAGEVGEIQERIAAIDKEIFDATEGKILAATLLAISDGDQKNPEFSAFKRVLDAYVQKIELDQGVSRKRGRPRKENQVAIQGAAAAYLQTIPMRKPAAKGKKPAGAAQASQA